MNIFYLSTDPVTAAEYACNKHVVKMLVETAQIFSAVHYILFNTVCLYKPTHLHHPCVKWAAKNKQNFEWLREYFYALAKEYTIRYSKNHKSFVLFSTNYPWSKVSSALSDTSFEEPPLCMPVEYHSNTSAVECYRLYYKGEKKKFAEWPDGKTPSWW